MCVCITCVRTTVVDVREINVSKYFPKPSEWPCNALLNHFTVGENTVASKMLHNAWLYHFLAAASLLPSVSVIISFTPIN